MGAPELQAREPPTVGSTALTAAGLPRTVEHPIWGERDTFVVTAEESGGEYVLLRVELAPGAMARNGPPAHRHRTKTETFRVIEGTVDFRRGDERRLVVRAGEHVVVPPMVPHRFWNSADAPATFEVEIRPPERFEPFLRTFYGLAQDGKVNAKGMPGILDLALIMRYGGDGLPLPARAVLGALARIARWQGRDRRLAKYLTPAE